MIPVYQRVSSFISSSINKKPEAVTVTQMTGLLPADSIDYRSLQTVSSRDVDHAVPFSSGAFFVGTADSVNVHGDLCVKRRYILDLT